MEVMSLTAPSSPRHFSGNYFLSAPTTPRRITEFYKEFHNHSDRLTIPFDWEETPGTPRKITNQTDEIDDEQDDFAFEIGDKSETTSLFAEELFDGGKIKPLKPPPYLQIDTKINNNSWTQDSSSSSPKSPIALFRKAFSPRKKPLEVDPFETAIDNARKGLVREERGRDRRQNSTRRAARSLSPLRVSAYPWEEQEQEQEKKQEEQEQEQRACVSRKSSSRKWRLKDFLLFRSASEGRARHNNKESIKTFSGLFRKREEVKNTNSKGSPSVSAHEFHHYIAKKAENKEIKRKTFLPYMQIGRFAF